MKLTKFSQSENAQEAVFVERALVHLQLVWENQFHNSRSVNFIAHSAILPSDSVMFEIHAELLKCTWVAKRRGLVLQSCIYSNTCGVKRPLFPTYHLKFKLKNAHTFQAMILKKIYRYAPLVLIKFCGVTRTADYRISIVSVQPILDLDLDLPRIGGHIYDVET